MTGSALSGAIQAEQHVPDSIRKDAYTESALSGAIQAEQHVLDSIRKDAYTESALSGAIQTCLDSTRKGAQKGLTMSIEYSQTSWHRPPHIYKDNTIYFITVRTMNKIRYFDTNEKKDILSDVVQEACKRFKFEPDAWTFLDNHYHLLVKVMEGLMVPKFINNINTNSSRLLNLLEGSRGRHIWHQYFDRCIRTERDYWIRFNYIHHNCVKHGYSEKMQEYSYSSYNWWMKEKGIEWMDSVFANYPILDFSVEGEVE